MTDDEVKMPTLTRFEILNLNDVYRHFKEASKHRAVRSTEANDASSRSHCLFMIDIIQQERTEKNPAPPDISFLKDPTTEKQPRNKMGLTSKMRDTARSGSPSAHGVSPAHLDMTANLIYRKDEPPIMHSKIVLADLAGSEKSSGKTGSGAAAGSSAFKEMLKINMSLTALGNVAHALHEGQSHVPYRDSTLTRILRPSFAAPFSKVLLISNLSPSQLTYDESFSTLQFANKVKAMKVSNSTVGADQQQLQFDYLETQKNNWALLADLHIAALHFENEPMLRRYTDVITPPFNVHRLRLKSQEKERQRLIKELESSGREEKVRIASKIEARKKKELAELQDMKKEIYDGLVDEYLNKVGSFQAQIDKLKADAAEFHATLEKDLNEREQETKEHEAATEALAKEKKDLRQRLEQGQVQLQDLVEQRTRLNEEEKKRKADTKQSTAQVELANDERAYAHQTWCHCKAQEYYFKYKAYRETHLALTQMYSQNVMRIEQAIVETKKLDKMLN
ncbi:Kinesin-like protein FLA10 [Diplonema papillatum]|nr:Kinesin-like protein FLA10 [Diplonema papillatum]KAJ9448092.1 Kinesin-like protein FLA10 [Diplonema papillatum]